jgi:hypothetical protein
MGRNIDAIRHQFGDPQVTSIIEGTLIRPAMYTIGGSIPEVAAFLEGYFSGAHVKASEASTIVTEWQDYVEFIGVEFGSTDWNDVFRSVTARFDSDDDWFDWLLTKYLQFKSNSP